MTDIDPGECTTRTAEGRSNPIRIARVDDDAHRFAEFVFPQRRDVLSALKAPWIAIGAWWHGVPAGLLLATVREDRAWLDSVAVASPLRRKGIGSALLRAFERHVRAAGAPRIETQYSGFLPARNALEGLLAANRWTSPALIDIQLVGLAGKMADLGGVWGPVRRAMRDMGDYAICPFEIDGHDDAIIDDLLRSAPELGVPDPRKSLALASEASVALRHRGTLIGWIAGERLAHPIGRGTLVPDTVSIHYTSARLADGHPRMLVLLGYHQLFSRQAELHGPTSRAVYRTHPGARAMYAFTRTRFAPMALHVEERFGAHLSVEATALRPSFFSQETLPC